jgi:DNA-binding response OmpR family regulator
MRVLLVANGSGLTTMVTTALRSRGHEVDQVATRSWGADLDRLTATPCDLVLVDLDFPDRTGALRCGQLRARTNAAIIALAARGRERAGVAALREGADDYAVWPLDLPELLARIDAVLRRTRPSPRGARAIGRLQVDLDRHQVTVDGELVALTPKEFGLLVALVRTPGAVVTRDRLMAEVWHATGGGRSRTLDSHVTTLRTKIGTAVTVANVRGVGYQLLEAAG